MTRKIISFTMGFILIPFIFGLVTSWFTGDEDYERFIGFWGGIYLLFYILFPFIHRGKIAQKFPNKYVMYAILYILAGMIFFLLLLL